MAELFNVRCKQGHLIITENAVKVKLANLKEQSLSRSAITAIDSSMGVPSIFGLGGGTNLVFHGQGAERLHADLVKPGVAKEIVSMLGF